jgi:hypothetical protein
VPTLHALGNGHFVLALQQRYGAHLPEIQPDRVVILVEHSRCKVQVAIFSNRAVLNIDNVSGNLWGADCDDILIRRGADRLKAGEVMFALLRLRRGLDGGQDTLFLVGKQVSALLTDADDASDLFTRFLIVQRQAVIPLANQLSTVVDPCGSHPRPQHFDAHTVHCDSLTIRVKWRR